MASEILERKLMALRQKLMSEEGRNNRVPAAIIGAEYGTIKKTGASGPYPTPIAEKLLRRLNLIGNLGDPGFENFIGCCCEVHSSNKVLLSDLRINVENVEFTLARNTYSWRVKRRCRNCQHVFGNGV